MMDGFSHKNVLRNIRGQVIMNWSYESTYII